MQPFHLLSKAEEGYVFTLMLTELVMLSSCLCVHVVSECVCVVVLVCVCVCDCGECNVESVRVCFGCVYVLESMRGWHCGCLSVSMCVYDGYVFMVCICLHTYV